MDIEGEESDSEMYDAAIAEAPTEEPKEEAPEVKEEGRQRDERGRFAAREQEPEPVVEEPKPVEDKPDHRIPLTELLNEREKRQSEQRRAEALANQLEQMQRQFQQFQRPQQVPDQFANPEEYNAYWENRFQQMQSQFAEQIKATQAENSLARAHERYGDDFEKGYQVILDRAAQGDRQAAQLVVNSPDPGAAIVNWYKRESTLQLVGDDPTAYTQRVLEEALKNPEFLAKALEAARGVAIQQPTQQIKVPPSLNKAPAAATRQNDMDPMSNAALYSYSIGR